MKLGHIVILEGPDGVGKTTLADAIERNWTYGPVVRMRHGPPPHDEDALLHYWKAVLEMEEKASDGSLVVSDRFHVGELVYGPLLRGGSRLTLAEAGTIDMILDGCGATMVHCSLPLTSTTARLVARDGGVPDPKSGAKLEQAGQLRAAFALEVGRTGMAGRLPGRWRQLIMNGDPSKLASDVIEVVTTSGMYSRLGEGWVGPAEADVVVYIDDCGEVLDLVEIRSMADQAGLRSVAVVDGHTENLDQSLFMSTILVCEPQLADDATTSCGRTPDIIGSITPDLLVQAKALELTRQAHTEEAG